MNNMKILTIICGVIVFLFSLLATVHIPSNSINSSVSLIKLTFGGPARTISLLNSYIMKINTTDTSKAAEKPAAPAENGKKSNKLMEMLLTALNSILLSIN